MKVLDTIVTACKKGASKAKELAIKAKDKALALIVGTSATIGATTAKAASTGITVTEGTGFTGSIDTVYYLTAVGIVVSFLGIAVAIGLGIRALKKA